MDDLLRFQAEILRNVFDSVIVTDLQGKILYWNEGASAIFGYSAQEMLGRTPAILYPNRDPKEMADDLKQILEGMDYVGEWQGRRIDGSVVWVDIKTTRMLDEEGRVIGFIGVARDITQRKAAEEDLRASEERGRLILKNVDEIVYMVAINDEPFAGNVEFVSARVKEILGYDPDDFIRNRELWLQLVHPEDRAGAMETARRIFADGKTGIREYRLRHKETGEYVWVEDRVVPRTDASGKVTGLFGVARDITRWKQTESDFLAYQKRLRALAAEVSSAEERERQRIASDLHDRVSQNLAMCRMKLEELCKAVLPSRPCPGVEVIHGVVEEIHRLIEEAIEESRLLIFELSPPVLHELGLESAIRWLAEQMQEKHGVRIRFRTDKEEKPLVQDLPVFLFKATRELLMNVIRHSRADRAEISICRAGQNMQIIVKDNGVGFGPSESCPRIRIGGAFGLFSIQERLKCVGGALEIQSTPGQGSAVTLTVPLVTGV